jgi:molybdopterin converting factor small subunit
MNIEVKLFYNLAQYLPLETKNKNGSIYLEEGSTIQNLLDKLGIPEQMTRVILVNGIRPKEGANLQEGDVVAIFPPLAGG